MLLRHSLPVLPTSLEVEKIHAMTDEEREKYFELHPKVGPGWTDLRAARWAHVLLPPVRRCAPTPPSRARCASCRNTTTAAPFTWTRTRRWVGRAGCNSPQFLTVALIPPTALPQILKRDVTAPVLEDKVDKAALPKIMQVRRDKFGKIGQTKYTHLADQDTTDR